MRSNTRLMVVRCRPPSPQTAQDPRRRARRPATAHAAGFPDRGDRGRGSPLGQDRPDGPARARVARGELRLPRPRPRGRPLAQPAPEDRRLRRLPVHRSPLSTRRGEARRRRARCVRRPGFPITIPNQPLQPVEYLFERCRPTRRYASSSSPAAPAISSTGWSMTASTTASRCCARSGTSSTRSRRDFEGRSGGDRARHLQCEAGDHQLPQGDPPAAAGARDLEIQAARFLAPRHGPRDLLRRHRRCPRARSGTCSRTTRR